MERKTRKKAIEYTEEDRTTTANRYWILNKYANVNIVPSAAGNKLMFIFIRTIVFFLPTITTVIQEPLIS